MQFIENVRHASDLFTLDELVFSWWSTVLQELFAAALVFFLILVVFRKFFAPRKIQAKAIPWQKVWRHELPWAVVTLTVGGIFIAVAIRLAVQADIIRSGPVSALAVLGEFAIYFFLFDFYFYCFHRLLHTRFLYEKVHKIHHVSTSPTPLTAFSFHPVEALLTGGFSPVMIYLLEPHLYSVIAIGAYGILNSLSVHCGHEFFPRWWYKNLLTRWYISPMFHDQHHQYFRCNYGGFLTLWDHVFGTARANFGNEFDALKARLDTPVEASVEAGAGTSRQ